MGTFNRTAVGGLVVATLTTGLAVGVSLTASAAVSPGSSLVINEVYGGGGNSGATYASDFVELYNKGTTNIDLSTYAVQYASATGTSYAVTPLSGTVGAGQYYLVKEADGTNAATALPTPNATGTIAMAAGAGKVALTSSATALTGTVTPATNAAVVDYVGYGTTANVFAGSGAAPTPSATLSDNRTGFANTADNKNDFTTATPTPTAGPAGTTTPPTTPPTTAPPASVTSIESIQGTTDTSPFAGQTVTTTGVVTASYPAAANSLNGFTIQTGGTGGTKDTSTASDGLFVYAPGGSTAAVGDSVSVTGKVSEYFGLTELSPSASTDVMELGTPLAPVTPATTNGWPSTDAARESLESMLYAPGSFVVTDSFTGLFNSSGAGFGEIGLAAGTKPLIQPTDVADAQDATAIAAVKADNAARAVVLDDGSAEKFGPKDPSTTPYLSQSDPVRVGAAVTFPAPVIVSYGNSTFKLEPTAVITASTPQASRPSFANTRESAPKAVGGDLSISSFNVLNYFTTLGTDRSDCSAFTDRDGNKIAVNTCTGANGPRGAWDATSLARQQIKIVKAINANDASVTGLMEIENSVVLGDPVDKSVSTLVDALNADAGTTKWAFVPSSTELPPVSLMDVINNAIIYQPAKVTRMGPSHALGTMSDTGQAFDNAREPIAQAFTPVGGGAPFLAVVNHFKSKGSGTDDGTGQGNANPDRVRQADALRDWVPGIQASYATPVDDTFLLGDFNSYTMEDPLQELYAAGYANLAQESDYSYSFSGLSGSLDHVLANASAQARVTGSDVWNINSPESVALEYSRFNYVATNFFQADPFAASDHDPVKVGFTSGTATTPAPTGQYYLARTAGGTSQQTVVFGGAGDTAVSGDFNGDGTTDVGTFDKGTWTLRLSTGVVSTFVYGRDGDQPIVGDWNHDGTDTVGVYRNGVVYLRNANTTGVADTTYSYGRPGDVAVAGDFDGDGTTSVGVRRGNVWYLTNTAGTADGPNVASTVTAYGNDSDTPVVGDYDGNGTDTIGVKRANVWYLSNSNTATAATVTPFGYGKDSDQPITGHFFDAGPTDAVGVFRS